MKNLDKILNHALNKALIGKKRIKRSNSNEIAQFVIDFIKENDLPKEIYTIKDMEEEYNKGFCDRPC